ncbi:hypothetical protein TheveDRAFT_0027 [Thermanaerovibrio velox DSM 12556]|uniref:MOSC domain-containing protein n=1 Tax=Thermanaerovibrio velox DSM 12556 TaxID=926567 RepID=H0UMS1_9BACT|nr:MOSC domain-containing protein [Thermanaerovibrio velox]EHM09216.1 hypothetical protein TheveDRAFT_0027 [Thermanaerovibrio velox DSM 12556]
MSSARLTAVCVSEDRREPKRPVDEALFVQGKGIEGDSHFGIGERQVSLLRLEDILTAQGEAGFPFPPGSLAENLVVEGLGEDIRPGQILSIGSVRLRVVEKGKKPGEPHTYDYRGWCLLPSKGFFLEVLQGGRVKTPAKVVLEDGDLDG